MLGEGGCLRAQGWAGRDHGEPQVCTQAGSGRARAAPQAQASGWEGGREREEGGEPGRCHCRGRGGAGDPAEGLQQCLVGAGAAMSLILGSGACVPGRVLHLSPAPRYHPEFSKGGGKGGKATESSLKWDANQQSWEKVNKGHAPCRRPASAHPPLRQSPVHFHSRSASPPPDSRAASESCCPLPQYAPWLLGLRTQALTWERCPPPLKKKKKLICAMPLNPRTEHAAPACSSRVHPAWKGGAGRRRWPPEGV